MTRRFLVIGPAAVALLALAACSEQNLVRPGVTDVLFQNPPTEVDILLVIDDSCSMEDEQNKLSSGFEEFVEFFEFADVDYHIGVTTTDMTASGGAGRLVSARGERIITPETDDAPDVFQDMVRVGTSGAAVERGLDAAWAAVTEPLISGPNQGFLRDDALLSIIFVSDEEDASVGSTSDFVNAFRALKGQRRRDAFNASALVGLDPDDNEPAECASGSGIDRNTAVAGWRYWDMALQTAGVARSICADNFAAIISEMGLASSRLRDTFQLSRRPDVESLEVTVFVPGTPEFDEEGLLVPPEGVGDEGLYAWEYVSDEDQDLHWIVFTDITALPPVDTRIVIRFELPGASS